MKGRDGKKVNVTGHQKNENYKVNLEISAYKYKGAKIKDNENFARHSGP